MYGEHHPPAKNIEDLEISFYQGRELPPHGNIRERAVDELIAEAHQRLLDAKAYFKPEVPESERDEKSKAPAVAPAAEPPRTKLGEKEKEAAGKKQSAKDFEAERAAGEALEQERAAHLERDPKFKEMQENLHLNQGKAEQASLAGRSPLEQKAYIWRRGFYAHLKTLLGEILLHTTPSARLEHLDRVYSWYKSQERAPEDHVRDFPLPPTVTPGFHNFMVEDGVGFDAAQVPGSSFYEPPKGEDDEEEEEAIGSATGRPKVTALASSGKVPRPKGLPPARERLREFRTRQLVGGPFSARGDGSDALSGAQFFAGKKLRDDSPSPERAWSPGGGLYTPRAGTATPSTHVPFSARSVGSSVPSRPPTAMEYSRPGTAFDNSRPPTAMGSRPPTATSYGPGGAASSYGDGSSTYGDFAQGGPLQAWGVGAPRAPPGGRSTPGVGGAKGRPTRRSLAEVNMEQRWLARRHKEISEMEREDEERRALQAWAERKARTEEESLRNSEACRFSSVLQRREYVMPPGAGQDVMREGEERESAEPASSGKRPGTAPPKRVDVSKPTSSTAPSAVEGSDGQDLHHQMLKQIRKMNAHLLHTITDEAMLDPGTSIFDGDSGGKHISLSPYLQRGKQGPVRPATDETEVLQNTCTLWCNKHKLAPGFEEEEDLGSVNLEGLRLRQLEEVEKIKRTFGHRNFPVNAQTLERALVMPQQKLKRGVDPCSLLPRLLINPFYESEFKKKTAKKKKKGRR